MFDHSIASQALADASLAELFDLMTSCMAVFGYKLHGGNLTFYSCQASSLDVLNMIYHDASRVDRQFKNGLKASTAAWKEAWEKMKKARRRPDN